MAKKRSKQSKKGKKQKHSQQSRPESKLRHYWQEGKWDGFVAMYLRRHAEPLLPQDLHDRWGDAVFNLLVRTLFVDRAPDMLPSLFEMLRPGPPLSGEVRACLELAMLYHRSLHADVSPAELDAIPADLPAPFDTLRAAMITAREAVLKDAREIVERGLPKRTTDQGLKALKGFVQSCDKLRQAGFRPKTSSTYKTLEKHAKALAAPLAAAGKRAVAVDLQILVGVCKHLFELQRDGESATALRVLEMLTHNKFTFTDHPALQGLVDMLLDQAASSLAPGVREELQRSLCLLYPSRADPAVRAIPRYQVIQAAFLGYVSSHGVQQRLVLHQACVRLLRADVWSPRERYVLMALGMKALTELAAAWQTLPFGQDDSEMDDVRTNIALWLREMLDVREQLGVQLRTTALPFILWDKLLQAAPLEFLAKQIRYLGDLSAPPRFPDLTLLLMADLAALVFLDKQARAFMQKLAGHRLPQSMELNEKDCQRLVAGLDFSHTAHESLETWRPYLDAPSWERILDAVAEGIVDRAIMIEAANPLAKAFWGGTDLDLHRYMAEKLPETAPLSGFFRMTVETGFQTLPKTKKQIALFFSGFPPPDWAIKLFFWMLSWQGASVASNTFLMEMVSRIAEELTRRNKWSELITDLHFYRRKQLYPDLLALWEEREWVATPPSEDFKMALEDVKKALRPKSTPKKKRQAVQRQKQRTLF